MPGNSTAGAPPRSFRQAGAVASVIAAQVAEAAILRAAAEGDHAKAERLRRLYDQHLASREQQEVA